MPPIHPPEPRSERSGEKRRPVLAAALALALAVALHAAPARGAAGVHSRAVCPETTAAACAAYVVTDAGGVTSTFASPPPGSYGPPQLHAAYGLPATAAQPVTIAIVAAGDDPTAEADLGAFSTEYGLPACTAANGCFTKLNQTGNHGPYPPTDAAWAQQTSLDLQVAHGVCQNCRLLLVEAASRAISDMVAAVGQAAAQGVEVIANSYGWGGEPARGDAVSNAYNRVGVVITAAAGNSGYGEDHFPAASPYVVAVGATTLNLNPDDSYAGESAWSGTSSFCDQDLRALLFQNDEVNASEECGFERAVADVSAVGDPATGVAVYDSTPDITGAHGWEVMGGTGLSDAVIAGAYGLAGGAHDQAYPAASLYAHQHDTPPALRDVTTGSNTPEPLCLGSRKCVAGPGYDLLTGVGTPLGLGAFAGGPSGGVGTSVTPADFTTAQNSPDGIATDASGDVYIVSATLFGHLLAKYAPDGTLIKQVSLGTLLAVGDGGRLARDPATGRLWNISHYGQIRSIDPQTLAWRVVYDLSAVHSVAGSDHVWDTSVDGYSNMSAAIQPWLSNFGDLAVRTSDDGHQLDMWVTAQNGAQNEYYVLRIRFRDGALDSIVPVVGASVQSPNSQARGIAVGRDGTVVTTLPIVNPKNLDGEPDALIAFSPDMPDGGEVPIPLLGGHDASSRGMTVDGNGNYYVTGLITSSLCGVSGGAVMVLTPKREFNRCYPYALVADGEDVAVTDSGSHVYSTIESQDPTDLDGGVVLDWGRLAAITITAAKTGTGAGTVTSSPPGINCGAACSAGYDEGTDVTLHAAAVSGSAFTGWSGGGCSGTVDCTVTANADATVTATFTNTKRYVTTYRDGDGDGTITSQPGNIDCGPTCSATFDAGTHVTLHAEPGPGSRFTGWSGGGCAGTADCDVTVDRNAAITGTFETVARPQLSVSRDGTGTGSVTSDPAGIDCGATCSHAFAAGTHVTLHAAPDGGSQFAGWSGGGCAGAGDCTVTMDADTSVRATFATAPPQRRLTVVQEGLGLGRVVSDPPGLDCGPSLGCVAGTFSFQDGLPAGTAAFAGGTAVTLRIASLGPGASFLGWSGAGCAGTATCTMTMDADKQVTATFDSNRGLDIAKAGSGAGTVTSEPAGIDCGVVCSAAFDHGATVRLHAAPSIGSLFAGWSGGGGCSGTGDCVLADFAGVTSSTPGGAVVATFVKSHRLSVQRSGAGDGAVTSQPGGIDCGAVCGADFADGSAVTLHAAPAAGSTFAGWSGGACTGTADCRVTVDADRMVVASFEPPPTPPHHPPVAAFSTSPAAPSTFDTVAFDGRGSHAADGSIVDWSWAFGDGSTATGPRPSHAYGRAGTYAVRLTVRDDAGATGDASGTVTVGDRSPLAAFTVTPAQVLTLAPVAFDATGSRDPDGSITGYSWSFGDGSAGAGAAPVHAYTHAGTFDVSLTVHDDAGNARAIDHAMTVLDRPPHASWRTRPRRARARQKVIFKGSASDADGRIVAYRWRFGDGRGASGRVTRHAYRRAGRYRVRLSVVDDSGSRITITRRLHVRPRR